MRLIHDEALAIVTIWQEARGEEYKGKVAIGEVIRNRMRNRYSSDGTIAGTVLRPWQFSGWNTEDINRIPSLKIDDDDAKARECVDAWIESIATDFTRGAVLYCNLSIVKPYWVNRVIRVAEIGAHTFYIEGGMKQR